MREHMSRRELKFHPTTRRNIPDNRHFFRAEEGGFYSYMFIQDIGTHIMPYSVHSSSGSKSFEVCISNPSLEDEVKTLFHVSYGRDPFYQSLSEIVFDFIREVASFLLITGGKAYFEIVEATIEDNEVSKPVRILVPIHGKIVGFGKTYYQMIPTGVKGVKEKYISVPKSKIWMLEIPRDFGRVKDIIALSNSLRELGKASLLGSDIITNQKKFFGFEFNRFHSLIESTVLRVTNPWGWDMRMYLNYQNVLEYYVYYRMLRFSYSMAILRDYMLTKMNILLMRLGYDVILSFSGIPSPSEILETMNKLEQRQISFAEVYDVISYL
jgi:hypothetical protein